VRAIAWRELGHPFPLETIVAPLRLGVRVIEVPTTWRARREGTSSSTLVATFAYARTGIRVLVADRRSLLRSGRTDESRTWGLDR
jgi:hypothetical protein